MKPRLFMVLLFVLAGHPIVARACSCASPGPTCQSFWSTDSVFVGEVLTIEPITVPRDMGSSTFNVSELVVRFRVSKAYRGLVSGEVAVQTGLGGGDCGYHFESGHAYLVFGHVSNGTLYTGICSATQPIEQAAAALAWLDSLPSRPKDASIFGTVTQRVLKDNQFGSAPMPGITISVTDSSGRESTTATDSSGVYSITGLAAGKYAISATLPKGMTGGTDRRGVVLHEQGCVEASFWLTTNGRISGHVFDSGGQSAKDITVALAYLDSPNFTARADYVSSDRFTYTDDHGGYGFDGLLPGKYVVFLNPFGFDEKRPYPRQFYGGGERLKTATKIDVAESGAVLDIDFTLPPPLTRKPVAVVVKDAQGLPIAGAQVSAHDQGNPNGPGLPSQNTGADGKATLEVYAERSYYITALINTESGKQRCGGPETIDPKKAGSVAITIVHPIGNCMAYLNPEFKGPR